MAKATYLKDLLKAYRTEQSVRWVRTNSPYKNISKARWLEVMNTYNRKVLRKQRHSVGKSNKFGVRLTASSMALALREMNMLAAVRRSVRASREQKLMLVGFLLLVSACGADYCEALPVSEKIYQTEELCQTVLTKTHSVRSHAVLMCGEVYSEDADGSDS